jgi:SpoIID/LytB domain protein
VAGIWATAAGLEVPATVRAQASPTEEDLEAASAGRMVAIGSLTGARSVVRMPLELYVARVLAGEGEPDAADAARQALAVAIRTYAIVQMGTHRREGFDLCDTTHCQVLRAADAGSRLAALATAGRVLTVDGAPAHLFYSASCGGRSEAAARVWPGATFPYMQVVRDDDVHEEDLPWTLELTRDDLVAALRRAGFGGGRLRDVAIDAYTDSGRVDRLRIPGLRPEAIAGTAFREALGNTRLRSTAFSISRDGDLFRFSGRGYGHGVGMCVVGAGRRAQRGESVEAILAQYYPGLTLSALDRVSIRAFATAPVPAARVSNGIDVRVPDGSTLSAVELERLAQSAYTSLSRTLGASVTPIVVELHDSLDTFRLEVRKPWWTSASVTGTTIDLAPRAVLEQGDGVEPTLRRAMAELLMSSALADRPAWVRVGGARYFAGVGPPEDPSGEVLCPADAELTLALSAAAQREAEARALRCFARGIAKAGDWRSVE